MYGDLTVPRFNMLSQYNIKGRILLLPIHGQGQSNITICKTPHLNLLKSDDKNAHRRVFYLQYNLRRYTPLKAISSRRKMG
jgi:Haemolymph juvenile hormone binding protein (JHBP)